MREIMQKMSCKMLGIFKLRFEWRPNKCVNANCLGGFSTIKSSRTKGRVAQPLSELAGQLGTSMITPKFDPSTPLHRTAMRTQKAGRLIFFLGCGIIQNLSFYLLFSNDQFGKV